MKVSNITKRSANVEKLTSKIKITAKINKKDRQYENRRSNKNIFNYLTTYYFSLRYRAYIASANYPAPSDHQHSMARYGHQPFH